MIQVVCRLVLKGMLIFTKSINFDDSGGLPASADLIKRIFEHQMPALPKVNMTCVDVRDVARAHVKAMTSPEAAGNRHILATSNHWIHEVGEILATEFTPQGYKPVKVRNNLLREYKQNSICQGKFIQKIHPAS